MNKKKSLAGATYFLHVKCFLPCFSKMMAVILNLGGLGKTGHLLELFDGEVTALEVDSMRVVKISQNMQRLGLVAKELTADVLNPQSWWDGQLFDAILLDAPCTASGIVIPFSFH